MPPPFSPAGGADPPDHAARVAARAHALNAATADAMQAGYAVTAAVYGVAVPGRGVWPAVVVDLTAPDVAE